MIRETTRDTTLSIPRSSDKEGATSLPVLKNTIVCVDMVGVRTCKYMLDYISSISVINADSRV